MSNTKGIIIGIDLGTTNSCMAYKRSGDEKCAVIPNAGGYLTTPSYIFFDKNTGEELVGQAAKRQSTSGNCVYESKRLIGRQFNDPEINNIKKLLNFSIVKAGNGEAWVSVNNKEYSPVEIAAKILRKLKQDAEAFLNEPVTRAVVTVPAYFNDSQRQATKDAGVIAGLTIERIVNEPTAAALAYGFDKEINQKIAVYDLGGGTFDVSILSIEDGTFEVLSTNGNTMLGGADFDQEIIKYLIQDFEMKNNLKIDQSNVSLLQRFKDEAEKAKIELSSTAAYTVTMPYLMQHNGALLNYEANLTKAKLEQLTMKLVEKSLEPCKLALKDAGLTTKDLHAVVLVGGMTRMPLVQDKVKAFFDKELFKGVNPDEVVALGAAIQGAILRGDVDGVLLLDVTPLTLGIETAGGVMTAIIERNTTIPCKKSQVFSTAADNQTQVGISVYQGERPMAADNNLLGTFVLDGIVPAKRGVPQIEVSFDIDANGILNVTAKDNGTNKEQAIKIQSNGGLTKEQIEKMKKEAEENSQKDKERAELVLAKNEAEQLVFNTEEHMKEHGSKISEEDQKNINDSIEKLKELSKSENIDEIKSAIDELKKNSMKLGEAMYKDSKNNKPENEETTETQGE